MKCSVCINTRNQHQALGVTLQSIFCQEVPFQFEVIVVDDGSQDPTFIECRLWALMENLTYIRLPNNRVRGPAAARNAACRMARGDVIVLQHGEIYHHTENLLAKMVNQLRQGEFLVAEIQHRSPVAGASGPPPGLPSPARPVPLLYLGAVWRRDLYAVGGCDEEFTEMGSEDNWLADCLIHGRGLSWRFPEGVVGWHQPHPRDKSVVNRPEMKELRNRKLAAAQAGKIPFCSSGGPWPI